MMPFQFTHPAYLLLLPPALLGVGWVASHSLAGLEAGRRRFSTALRMGLVAALVLALAGLQSVRTNRNVCTLFLIDVSASISPALRQEAIRYVNAACKGMNGGDQAGVIVFGKEAYIEVSPRPIGRGTRLCPPQLVSTPAREFSDLSAALRLATAAFPPGLGRRIVLLSDGNENLGRAREQSRAAKGAEVEINTVALDSGASREALLDRMTLPRAVKKGEPFELKLVATGTAPATGVVRILEDDRLRETRTVQLPRGKTVLSFPLTQEKTGFHRYKALLDVRPDTEPENNRAEGFVEVKGQPRVLYVDGLPEQGRFLAKALASQGIEVVLRGPEGVPRVLSEFQGYDSFLLSDVPAWQVSPRQMEMIRSSVRDLGLGFGMVGGQNSFGAGGYFKTPVEDALPVTMDIRKQRVFPSMSVAIVMDKSGSMGVTEDGVEKVRLAAEAAITVMDVLQPIDRVGLIAYDSRPEIVAPLTEAASKASIQSAVASVRAGGGTNVYPGLEAGHAMLRPAESRIRHVILLADGSDAAGQQGCPELVRRMAAEKITLTVVAFGAGPDVPFLQWLARLGKGNFYLAERARDLPRIFTKDAMLMSKSLLIEEPFLPRVDPSDEVMRGIDWSGMPPLTGYVATTPRSLADVPARSHKDDPVFAHWQYGLGRSIAFTSDAKAHWAARWVGWSGFSPFWSQAVRWSMRRTDRRNFQVTVETEGGKGHAVLDAADENSAPLNFLRPKARVVMPDLSVRELTLDQTGLGRYEGNFPADQIGTYLVHAQARLPDGKPVSLTDGLSIPYPPEYRDLRPDRTLLDGLSRDTGGRTEPEPAQVFGGQRPLTRIPTDLWWALALAAALLLPADVAVRRLMIGLPEIRKVWERARLRRGESREGIPSPTPSHVDRLLAVKAPPKNRGVESVPTPAPTLRSPPREGPRESEREGFEPVPQRESPSPSGREAGGKSPVDPSGDAPTGPPDGASLTDRLLTAKRRTRKDR